MKLMDKGEAAKYLHIAKVTLDKHVKNGLVIPARVGGRVFFREETLDHFIRSCERKPKAQHRERAKEVRV